MTAVARRFTRLAVATLVATAGLIALHVGPAAAAACSTSGITAVVDANDGAGGGTQTSCDPTTSSSGATAVFGRVGVSMTRNPDGSVCKVEGKPASAQCGRLGNQYWALWWSDGTSGKWVYSQSGVDGLDVPRNGAVAWAWQGPSGRRQPGVAAPVLKATPTAAPTKKPTKKPTPTKKATPAPVKTKAPQASSASAPASVGASADAQASASTSASASASAGTSAGTSPSAGPTTTPSASVSAVATPSDTDSATPQAAVSPETELTSADADSGGLPLWVPVAVVVLLAGATAGVLWRRRTSGGRPGA